MFSSLSYIFTQETSKPLELPNFIIEGKEQIDVQVTGKQFPTFETFMPASIIDTLSFLEKPRSYVIFPYSIPENIIKKNFPTGYVGVKFGSFFTLGVNAGYQFNYQGYSLFGFADLEASRGHINNGGYLKYLIGLQSDYVAPDKFFIFGKSVTTTNLEVFGRSYKLFAIESSPSRSLFNSMFSVKSTGVFEGNEFNVGAKFYYINQSGLGTLKENSISGYLQFEFPFLLGEAKSNVSINLRQSKNKSTNFHQISLSFPLTISDITINPLVGVDVGYPTYASTRFSLHLEIPIMKTIRKDLTFSAKIFNQLKDNSFQKLINYNPYFWDSLELDYSNATGILIGANYRPLLNTYLSAELNFTHTRRDVCVGFTRLGLFNVLYLNTNSFKLNLEGQYEKEYLGIFTANAYLEVSSITSNKKDLPNRPIFTIGGTYFKKILENLNLTIKFDRIGERFADIQNDMKLYAYNNLGILINYLYGKNFTFNFELENLLNSNIVYWYGYKERGLSLYFNFKYKF